MSVHQLKTACLIYSLWEKMTVHSQGRRLNGGIRVPLRKGRSNLTISNVATEISSTQEQAQKLSKENQRPVYPFPAIVGQDEMKLCLLLNVIDPKISS